MTSPKNLNSVIDTYFSDFLQPPNVLQRSVHVQRALCPFSYSPEKRASAYGYPTCQRKGHEQQGLYRAGRVVGEWYNYNELLVQNSEFLDTRVGVIRVANMFVAIR